MVVAIKQYSTFAEERDTMCSFVVFHEMGELLRRINQPVREF